MIFRQLLRLAPWLLSAFILCAAIWHTNANAETNCESVAGFAETVMEARQKGVSLVKMMQATDNKLLQAIIMEAYETPRYSTEEYQARKIGEFRDSWYLACLKNSGE